MLWANERLVSWIGAAREEIIGNRLQTFLSSESRADYVSVVYGLVAGKETDDDATSKSREDFEIVGHIMNADGGRRTVSLAPRTAPANVGELINVTIVDLADQVELDAIHNQTEEHLKVMLETSGESTFCIDRRGRITICNNAFLSSLGYEDEGEVIGEPLHKVMPHILENNRLCLGSADHCLIHGPIRSGESTRCETNAILRVDGARLPIEFWSRALWRGDAIVGAVCTFVDITERRARQAQLAASEARLAFANNMLGIAHIEFHGDEMIASANFADVLGFDAPTARKPGKEDAARLKQTVHADDLDRVLEVRRQALKKPGCYHVEFRAMHPTRGRRHFEVHGNTSEDPEIGLRTFFVIVDTTQQFRAQLEVRESEERLRRLLDGLLAHVVLLTPEGHLIMANKAALEAGGIKLSGAIGESYWCLDWWSHDADQQKLVEAAVREAGKGKIARQDLVIRTADDKRMTLDLVISPLLGSDGEVKNVLVSGIDITERAAIEGSRNRLADIVDQTVDLVGTCDREGRMLYVNRAGLEMMGRSLDELRGEHIALVHPQWASDRVSDEALPKAAIDGTWSGETEIIGADGKSIPVLQTVLAHYNEAGEVSHFSTIARDISTIKRNEEHQSFLLREILHRSKNLLAVIQAMASQTASQTDTVDRFITQFKKRVQGLSMSHDLLVRENYVGVSLEELVRGQLRTLISDGDLTRVHLSGPSLTVAPAAAQALGLAFHELGTNAVRFGALSQPHGDLAIDWGITRAGDDDVFVMSWQESDGPAVEQPEWSGFGRMVVEDHVAQSLDGDVTLVFRPVGVQWELRAPTNCLVQPED